jgi:hypothetical protein
MLMSFNLIKFESKMQSLPTSNVISKNSTLKSIHYDQTKVRQKRNFKVGTSNNANKLSRKPIGSHVISSDINFEELAQN